MILAGSMNCLRGFPGLKNLEFLFVYHNKDSLIFERISGPKPKPTVVVSKDKIISIDLLLPDILDLQCKSMVNDVILGEILFGSAHIFMDGKWRLGNVEFPPVKCILCISYKGEMEEAWKAPPEYYQDSTGGDAGGSSYQYMGEY